MTDIAPDAQAVAEKQKRPSFQFYPYDWKSDLKLRRCSPAARGVWLDILCAFHDSDDAYGLLRWPLKEIASTVGASMAHVRELIDKGVLRGHDTQLIEPCIYVPRSGRKSGAPVTLIAPQPGPIWFSKRMVKDEYVRTIRGEGTRFGETSDEAPKAKQKAAPKPPFGDGSSSSSSSSASHDDDKSRRPTAFAHEPETPATWEAWRLWFEAEVGIESDPYNAQDRAKFRPLAQAWVTAGVTTGQMRAAIAKARSEAKESIAYLPAYVDRVLASMAAPSSPKARSATERRVSTLDALTGKDRQHAAASAASADTIDVDAKRIG